MKSARWIFAALPAASLLIGCGSAATAFTAYNNVRGAATAYHATQSVKDAMKADPIFDGYAALVPQARLVPRDQDKAAQVQIAFIANLKVLLETDARITGAPLSVYATPPPGLRTLIVQFNEDDYGHTGNRFANVVNAVTVGDKLTGTVLFTDAATGAIVAQKKVEVAQTYGDVTKQVQTHIVASLLRTLPPDQLQARGERISDELSKVQVVAPAYEPLLGRAS